MESKPNQESPPIAPSDFGAVGASCTEEDENPEEEVYEINETPLKSDFYTNLPPLELKTELFPHQKDAVAWMESKENRFSRCTGAVLGDDMGLGKTMDCIAFVLNSVTHFQKHRFEKRGDEIPMCTLVVVPLALLNQWQEEIQERTNVEANHVLVYHGSQRRSQLKKFLEEGATFLVLTTYDIVLKEYMSLPSTLNRSNSKKGGRSSASSSSKKGGNKDEDNILFTFTWYRIILDEAHRIRTDTNLTTKAIMFLLSRNRWCVTGTPFNNTIDDLYTLARFVGVPPFNTSYWWNCNRRDLKALRAWANEFVLRRKKEAVLKLPKQKMITITVDMSESEQKVYEVLLTNALKDYVRFQKSTSTVRKTSFSNVLSAIFGLRQFCNHPALLLGRAWTRPASKQSSAKEFHVLEVCCQCKTSADQIGYLKEVKCGHYVCQFCRPPPSGQCETCTLVSPWIEEQSLPTIQDSSKGRYSLRSNHTVRQKRTRNFLLNNKCAAIVNHCRQHLTKYAEDKVVIFSQWTGYLDLIEYFLSREGIESLRYDGDASVDHRNGVQKRFNTDNHSRVLLNSLRCGGLGLNLARANVVILADGCYNPAAEKQAQDRVSRIGQIRPVTIVRVLTSKSIEVDVANAQKDKRRIEQSIFEPSDSNDNVDVDLWDKSISDDLAAAAGMNEIAVCEFFKRTAGMFSVQKSPTKSTSSSSSNSNLATSENKNKRSLEEEENTVSKKSKTEDEISFLDELLLNSLT